MDETKQDTDPLDVEKTMEQVPSVDQSLGDMPTMRLDAECIGVVDRYELIEKLGQGGFGAVYRARDNEAGVEVALKALPPLVSHDPEELENVRANFALVANLAHPNIATVRHLHRVENPDNSAKTALGVSAGDYLVVMEYVKGTTLSTWRAKFPGKQVPVNQALEICKQIAAALDYAHGQKIIHRDIKPSNVMVFGGTTSVSSKDGTEPDPPAVKVLDFGLAAEIRSSMSRVSQEQGDSSGTRPYMAPEQWMGKRQGAYTDQYALAVLFYELISGEVPFLSVFETGDTQLMRDVVKSEAIEPLGELSEKQNAVLQRALEKDAPKRFGSCGDFITALSGGKVSNKRNVATKGAKRSTGTRNAVVGLCLVAVMGGGGFFAYTTYQSHQVALAEQARLERLEKERRQKIASLLADADAKFTAEKYTEAANFIDAVLEIDPENVSALKLRSSVQRKFEELETAKRWQLHELLASAEKLYEQEKFSEAMLVLGEMLKLDASNDGAKKIQNNINSVTSPAKVALLKSKAKKRYAEVVQYDRDQGFGKLQDEAKLNLDAAIDLFDNQNDSVGAYGCFQTVLRGCQILEGMELDRIYSKTAEKWRLTISDAYDDVPGYGKVDIGAVKKYASASWEKAQSLANRAQTEKNSPEQGATTYGQAISAYQAAVRNAVSKMTAKVNVKVHCNVSTVKIYHDKKELKLSSGEILLSPFVKNVIEFRAPKYMRTSRNIVISDPLGAPPPISIQLDPAPKGADLSAEDWVVVNDRWIRNIYANGHETLSDTKTGLMWLYDSTWVGEYSRYDAKKRCQSTVYAGYEDWYLPERLNNLPTIAKNNNKERPYWSSYYNRVGGEVNGFGYIYWGDGTSSYIGEGEFYKKAYVWPCRKSQ